MKTLLLVACLFITTLMSAHNVLVNIYNESNTTLTLIGGQMSFGAWTQGTPQVIAPKSKIQFGGTSRRTVGGVVTTGVEGSVRYKLGNGEFYIYFNNPLISGSKGNTYKVLLPAEFEYSMTGGLGNNAEIHVYIRNSVPHYVGNFKPSTHGFPFANSWKGYSYPLIDVGFLGQIKQSASYGMCGGMAYAVKDHFEANIPVPNEKPVNDKEPYFTYIADRLKQSLGLIDASMYLKFSDPLYPDTDTNITGWIPGDLGGTPGRAYTVLCKEWPNIQADILANKLVCLGLIFTKEMDLGSNHQVLCYGYQMLGNRIKLFIYDSNKPDDNNLYIEFENTTYDKQLTLNQNFSSKRLNCLFRTHYERRTPVPHYYFMSQLRCANKYASEHNFLGAYPNFHHAYKPALVFGTIFINKYAGEWKDIKANDIGNPATPDARFRAVNDYAAKNGFLGALPNFFEADYGQGKVYGTIFIKKDAGEWRDIKASELGNPQTMEERFRAINDYATRNGFLSGFPNFHEANNGQGTVYGAVLLKRTAGEWQDIERNQYASVLKR